MKNLLSVFFILILTTACSKEEPVTDNHSEPAKPVVQATEPEPEVKPLVSGVDTSHMDTSVRPQDDFFSYANGTWIKNVEIPADKTWIGTFITLNDKVDEEVRAIIEKSANMENMQTGSPEQKVGDLYNSFMDEEHVNKLGLDSLKDEFARIDALENYSDLAGYFAYTTSVGLTSPIAVGIIEDFKDPTRYVCFLFQSGLGLPNRDYYFDESEKGQEYIKKYREFMTAMYKKLGHKNPGSATDITYELEKRLATKQRNPVENRQYDKWDNKYDLEKLKTLMADFDWKAYTETLGISDQKQISAAQPEYFADLNKTIKETPLSVWKDYLKLRMTSDSAPLLSEDIYRINFDFYNKTLRGQQEPLPRWQRGVKLVNSSIGELVGQVYVKEHFPPEAKQRMLALVDNLVEAYRESIIAIDWMGEETKKMALVKLENFLPKIGYPDKWKSYDTVKVDKQTLVENVKSANIWNMNYEITKLNKPADRHEWSMNPQVVNAYYHPIQNTINFPAGILQPPMFNMAADEAANYGAIGMIIGHEIGHGFDDQGSKFDGDGLLNNWWSDEDRAAFEKLTGKLVEQFNQYEVLPDLFVNGELTQGENIGDLAGMSIAYKAYQKSLNGKQAAVIDGLSGDQRFFLGFAQAFRGKMRDDRLREQVKTDPHSPTRYRVNGIVKNVQAFYEAFDVKEGDKHYLPPGERVRIW